MEAGAIARYSNALKTYGDNVAGIKAALNEGVTLRQNNRLNAIANTQRQKLQNIFLSNVVNDEKLREIHESLSNLSIQAGAAPEALMKLGQGVRKLNDMGAFDPVKRAGVSLAQKIRTAGTSSRLSGTALEGDNVGANAYQSEGLTNEGTYVPKDPDAGIQMENFNPMNQAPKPSKLRTTLTKAKEPPTEIEGQGQVGKVGSNFDLDDDGFHGGSLENFRSGMPGTSSDPVTNTISDAANVGSDVAETAGETAGATAAETAGAETAGAVASETAGAVAASAGTEAGVLGTLGAVSGVAGPLSVLAGLGFGIYELVQAFKPHPHPDMTKVKVPAQVKTNLNQQVSHRMLSVAPGANSAILQASQSSAV